MWLTNVDVICLVPGLFRLRRSVASCPCCVALDDSGEICGYWCEHLPDLRRRDRDLRAPRTGAVHRMARPGRRGLGTDDRRLPRSDHYVDLLGQQPAADPDSRDRASPPRPAVLTSKPGAGTRRM